MMPSDGHARTPLDVARTAHQLSSIVQVKQLKMQDLARNWPRWNTNEL
jgi:hypothetical protein